VFVDHQQLAVWHSSAIIDYYAMQPDVDELTV
jgi:hypothetical protein